MDRETLLALELVARYEARLAEPQRRILALEQELARFRRPPKTPGNSSVPPSQGQRPSRGERRRARRGARPGHRGSSRYRARPDVRLDCRPERCGGCRAEPPPEGQRLVARRQVVELPVTRACAGAAPVPGGVRELRHADRGRATVLISSEN